MSGGGGDVGQLCSAPSIEAEEGLVMEQKASPAESFPLQAPTAMQVPA